MTWKRLIVASSVFLLATPSFGLATHKTFFVGVGAIGQNLMKTSTSTDASVGIIGEIYPTASVTLDLGWLIPNVSYTVLGRSDIDGAATKRILTGSLNIPLIQTDSTDVKAGPGIWMYSIKGNGGTILQNNGTGTATYTLPSGEERTENIMIDLGIGFRASRVVRFDIDALLIGVLSTRRSANVLAQVSLGLF